MRSNDDTLIAAKVVYIDWAKDIAILRTVDDTPLPVLMPVSLAEADADSPVEIVTYREADGPLVNDAHITKLLNVTLDGEGKRQAMELEAVVRPGDSGAPVIADNGKMVGMVFAKARVNDRAWAIESSEIEDALAKASETESAEAYAC